MGSHLIGETGFRQGETGLRNAIKAIDVPHGRALPMSEKKQGATGITTVAPYVAGQWGRGEDRLSG